MTQLISMFLIGACSQHNPTFNQIITKKKEFQVLEAQSEEKPSDHAKPLDEGVMDMDQALEKLFLQDQIQKNKPGSFISFTFYIHTRY